MRELSDEQIHWVCDTTGLARIDVVRVMAALTEVEDQVPAIVADGSLVPLAFPDEMLGSLLRGNAFMRNLSSR